MATTTNYGWTTPDDTALVKDGASAIRTLGSSVDTTTKALNPETTLGDIAYRSSTANVKTRLGIGSTGQVLTVAGGVPTWATSSGGSLTQLATGNLSGSVIVTISSISQSYKNLYLYLIGAQATSGGVPSIRFNGDDAGRYSGTNYNTAASSYGASTLIKLGNDDVQSGANADFDSLYINNYSLTIHKTIYVQTASNTTAAANNYFGYANYNQTTAVSSIDILNTTAASFTGGTYTLFGVN